MARVLHALITEVNNKLQCVEHIQTNEEWNINVYDRSVDCYDHMIAYWELDRQCS